jgi:hypothetical protein
LATSLAVSLSLSNFVLKGDSTTVITALQDPSIILDWQLDHIICNFFFFSFQPFPLRRLEKLTEVQTSAPITWQIGPRLDLFLTAFPPYLPPLFLSPFVVEKIHPLLFPPSEVLCGLLFLGF